MARLAIVRRCKVRKPHVWGLGWKGVAVDLKGEGRAVMPELLRDEDDIDPRLQRQGRVGVTARVHHERPDPLFLSEGVESLPAPPKI